ncbi:MAG: aminomethyl-transferring glycine dehydrogenase [Bacteroidia bacterium]
MSFVLRHIPHTPQQIQEMLSTLGVSSLEELINQVVPAEIRRQRPLSLPPALSEKALLRHLKALTDAQKLPRSFIGTGYYGSFMPPVIQRNVLENPGWYTAYTPYQPEIAQGRLELLMLFQTAVSDLTGLPIANASLLDEATAAAEAMQLFRRAQSSPSTRFFVDAGCHPQVIAVVQTRATFLDVEVDVGHPNQVDLDKGYFGALLAYPTTEGLVPAYLPEVISMLREKGIPVAVASDLLVLTLIEAPGTWGADVVLGSTQRWGLPMGYGGPHAAFFAVAEKYKRFIPGRLVGLSVDAFGRPAYRLALQTREQHIRREKATSNICTAQVLPANLAVLYAIYHGPEGLKKIAQEIHYKTLDLAQFLLSQGYRLRHAHFWDTLTIEKPENLDSILQKCHKAHIALRQYPDGALGISLDEVTTQEELDQLKNLFHRNLALSTNGHLGIPSQLLRQSPYLNHPTFHQYHGEHEMLRYLKRLESRDLSLTTSMIPLGSCTMKLNPTTTLLPLSWDNLAQVHPALPLESLPAYKQMIEDLGKYLCEITEFDAVSFQPNSGAQGEYTGLLVIRRYHQARGEGHRDVVLIPASAHGTNPASAVMAGLKVIIIQCDAEGNIDLKDLTQKATQYRDRLAALMVTYPSTHGIYEENIRQVCNLIHECGGQVYMDGANMNAQVGLTSPRAIGADVCHLNLHKTFAIPHGGGGPGMGPILVAQHLAPYLPQHPWVPSTSIGIGPVGGAPYGSALILWISYSYIRLLGAAGLTYASQIAILNANYLRARLSDAYELLYKGKAGYVAHEFILDLRPFKYKLGIEVEDIAKRLMDYGYHAPTVSFPVPGTLMIEPTESESKTELDRLVYALLEIRKELQALEEGLYLPQDNPLKNAPHSWDYILQEPWLHPYSREKAFFPAPWLKNYKYWPPVARIDNAYGDRNLVCVCPPTESYTEV